MKYGFFRGREKFLVVTRHTGRSRSEATACRTRSVPPCGERLPGKGPWSGPDEGSGVSGVSPVDRSISFSLLRTDRSSGSRTAPGGSPRH